MVKKACELNEPYADGMDVKDLLLGRSEDREQSLQSNELLEYLHN